MKCCECERGTSAGGGEDATKRGGDGVGKQPWQEDDATDEKNHPIDHGTTTTSTLATITIRHVVITTIIDHRGVGDVEGGKYKYGVEHPRSCGREWENVEPRLRFRTRQVK